MTRKDYVLVASILHQQRVSVVADEKKYNTWNETRKNLAENFIIDNDKFDWNRFIDATDNCKKQCANCK